MTIIFEDGERFWIENLFVTSSSLAANSNTSVGLNLERVGRCVGISYMIEHNISNEDDAAAISSGLRNQSTGGAITYGNTLSSVGVRRGNASAGALSFGVRIMVYMRKN